MPDSHGTKIEWTHAPGFKGETWNVINGCALKSEGCRNCYAADLATTRLKNHPSRTGLARRNADGVAKFTGEVRLVEHLVTAPLRWKKPRMVFVCAHGDLFYERVPDAWIDRLFAVMALCPQHIFIVLTKRPERMRGYLGGDRFADGHASERIGYRAFELAEEHRTGLDRASALIHGPTPDHPAVLYPRAELWPLPNVWLGVSVEDQPTADERIPLLLDTPAAIRWISAEPLLGPVDLGRICIVPKKPGSVRAGIHINALAGRYNESGMPYIGEWDIDRPCPTDQPARRLDWVVAGGESGTQARPMHPDWARSLRDQCAAADVPFLFKQWGAWSPGDDLGEDHLDGAPFGAFMAIAAATPVTIWRDDLPQDMANANTIMFRVGKKAAGRMLDGRTHDAWPVVA